MSNFILSCCSTADLSKEHFNKRDIHYICFHYELDGVQYNDDLGQSMPFDKFYQAMADGAETKPPRLMFRNLKSILSRFCSREKIFCIYVFLPV